jgi:hypothetical protein
LSSSPLLSAAGASSTGWRAINFHEFADAAYCMRILLLTHAFNSLTQRLGAELQKRGHEISIEFDIADSVAEEAVALFRPDLIVAPYLRRAIPESIWQQNVCLIVHPGIIGDRGPSALDWAIQAGEGEWGVTVLQAEAEMDAGPVWASATFPLRAAKKSSIYRNEVTQAANSAVLQAVERYASGGFAPVPLAVCRDARGGLRPLIKQTDRVIDWQRDDTATVLRKINAADGFPGVADTLFGEVCMSSTPGPRPSCAVRRMRSPAICWRGAKPRFCARPATARCGSDMPSVRANSNCRRHWPSPRNQPHFPRRRWRTGGGSIAKPGRTSPMRKAAA